MPTSEFINPLPGVPDVESPFFDALFSAKAVSPETLAIARQIHDRGYAVIEFPDPDFAARTERIQQRLGPGFDLDHWREHLRPRNDGLRVQDAWRDDPDVRAIATNPEILRLLGELYGRHAFPFQTLNFPVGTQQEVHSDSVHFSSIPERFMCGVWVAMEDTDGANGSLEYYPGSHRFSVYANEHLGVCSEREPTADGHYARFWQLWRALVRHAGIAPETCHARKGQAFIWSANLLHGGSPHRDGARTRWSQVTHYFFDDCAYYTPLLSDPAYGDMAYRELVDISTGEVQANAYAGHPIDRAGGDRTHAAPPA